MDHRSCTGCIEDRALRAYHNSKKNEKHVAFVLRSINDAVTDVSGFRRELDELLRDAKQLPSELYAGALFINGPYSSEIQDRILHYFGSKQLAPQRIQRLDGDYFTLHRYVILSQLDQEAAAKNQ